MHCFLVFLLLACIIVHGAVLPENRVPHGEVSLEKISSSSSHNVTDGVPVATIPGSGHSAVENTQNSTNKEIDRVRR
ncbi:hypothetical protein PENTCL1PPCAC_12430, partial [Pristionchus entomophagus]